MGFGMCVPGNAVSVLYLCCPMSFRLSFCGYFTDRKHYAVQPFFLLLQLYHGQFFAVRPQCTVHAIRCFFAAKLRKDRIQRKEYIVVIIEAPEKWKPQILLGISGRSFPQTACGKFPEKWKAFSTRKKVESLWSGKQKFVEKIVENLPHSKYRFHKLWKIYSTAFYHRFHKPASTAVKCCGHSRHFFCTWIFNRLLKRMWKTCRRRWNSCGIGKKALQNPVFHMFCSVLSQFSMRGFCCGYF